MSHENMRRAQGALLEETQEIGSFPMNGKMKSRRKKRSDLDSHLEYFKWAAAALIIHAQDAASNMHNSYQKKVMKNDHMNLNDYFAFSSCKEIVISKHLVLK